MELRRQLFGQRLSPVNQRDGRGIRVDGADDIPNLGLIGWRRILVMNPGPHGTSHIMEHFGSDGPKQKTAESAVSVGRGGSGLLYGALFRGLVRGTVGGGPLTAHGPHKARILRLVESPYPTPS